MNKPITVLTGAEWATRVADAAEKARVLLPQITAAANGPGEAVLIGMLIARSICDGNSALPDFAWYYLRIRELPHPADVS